MAPSSEPGGRARRVIRSTAFVVFVLSLVWASYLLLFGGIDTRVFGVPFTTNEPLRPLLIAIVALAAFAATHGAARTYAWWSEVTSRVNDRLVAILATVFTVGLGLSYMTTAAIGPDPYGYVSQADLWLERDLKIEQPWTGDAPWPSKHWSFAPLGYRPLDTDPQWTIVPTYSPGLPMLMAAAKAVGGHCALFLIVPLLGGVMVLATYGIGVRMGSARAGMIAACLVAVSPTFVHMLMAPMSDVAVAGVWALAFYCLLGTTRSAAVTAGLLTGLAILIRPNLFFLAGAMGVWYFVRALPGDGGWSRRLGPALAYGVALAPGVVGTALVYTYLYGSPTTSGYGRFEEQFAWANVVPNLRNYFSWFVETQTPLALIGPAALLVPLRRFWSWVRDRSIFVVIGLYTTSLLAHYFGYLVFDNWSFLRFLLPCWPFLMLGVATVAIALARPNRPAMSMAVSFVMVGLVIFSARTAARVASFDVWKGDRRYIDVAKLVERSTPPRSVMLTMIYSGTLRYYGGRMTVRYDILDADWLDRAVAWMTERGITVYAVLEEWELERFRERFAGQETTRLLETPVIVHEDGARAYLYNLSQPPPPKTKPRVVKGVPADELRCVPPEPRPTISFR